MQSQKRQNDLSSFPRQTIQYHAEEAEVEQFYEDLQDLLELTLIKNKIKLKKKKKELTLKKDVLFIIGDWMQK